jgi:hypothetical protein
MMPKQIGGRLRRGTFSIFVTHSVASCKSMDHRTGHRDYEDDDPAESVTKRKISNENPGRIYMNAFVFADSKIVHCSQLKVSKNEK